MTIQKSIANFKRYEGENEGKRKNEVERESSRVIWEAEYIRLDYH